MADALRMGVLAHSSSRGGALTTLPTTGQTHDLTEIWFILAAAVGLVASGAALWQIAEPIKTRDKC